MDCEIFAEPIFNNRNKKNELKEVFSPYKKMQSICRYHPEIVKGISLLLCPTPIDKITWFNLTCDTVMQSFVNLFRGCPSSFHPTSPLSAKDPVRKVSIA